MSELTAYKGEIYIPHLHSIIDAQVYCKSDADRVIANLEDKLQAANTQVENLINSASSIMLFQDKVNDNKCTELRHANYKRCVAMVGWCKSNALYYEQRIDKCWNDGYASMHKEFYQRWHKRWLKLVEHYKEAK